MSSGREKIIIVGGGFGGVKVALELSSKLSQTDIILVNDTSYHCYIPDLYAVAGALLKDEDKGDFINLEGTVNIPLQQIFAGKPVQLIVDKVLEISPADNSLKLAQEGNLKFDFLVLALGSTTNFFGVEGADKFSHTLKTVEDALNIRDDLEELVHMGKSPRIIIAGGGFTGVELAGSLQVGKIIVVEATAHLLAPMPTWAQEAALKRLKKLGVEVKLNCPIKKVSSNNLICQDGTKEDFDYLIWTAGVKGALSIKGLEEYQPTKKSTLEVEENLMLKESDNIFVTGDLAQVPDEKTGHPVPGTAYFAIEEGKMAAKNIAALINGQPLSNYRPGASVFVVSVGPKFALSNWSGLKISGILGWVLKKLVALNYFLSILPVFEAVKVWWKGVRIYYKND